MTTQDDMLAMLTAYHDCRHAVAWCEAVLVEMVKAAQQHRVGVDDFLDGMRHSLTQYPPDGDPETLYVIQHAKVELELPSFRRYVAAKLGLF